MAQTRKTSEARREEVACAALRIVGERGLKALSTMTLANEVGVTTGALFRHFPSFDAILDEAIVCAVRNVELTFPDRGMPALERLIELAARRVELLSNEPGIAWLLRSEQALLSLPPEAVAQLRALAKRSRSFLIEAIREGAMDGTIRRDIDADVLVIPVIGTIHTLADTPGVRRVSARTRTPDVKQVLDALKLILAPPDVRNVTSSRTRTTPTRRR